MAAAKKKITEAHWNMIVDRIHDRSCIPFLGAGVNVTKDPYAGLPLGGDVALQLIAKITNKPVSCASDLAEVTVKPILKQSKLDKDLARVMVTNLPRVSQHVLHELDWPYFKEQVQAILNEAGCQPSPLLKVLAHLPFSLIVTTNYDRLLEAALSEAMAQWWRLHPRSVREPAVLLTGLKTPASRLATELRNRLPAAVRKKIDAWSAKDVPVALLEEVVREIDALLAKPILAAADIADEPFPDKLIELAKSGPKDAGLFRLNRWMLEESFPDAITRSRKTYEVIVQPTRGFDTQELKRHVDEPATNDVLTVYKIHGSFSDNKQSEKEILITEDDYVEFLTIVATDAGVPSKIASRINSGNLLFLGYGLEDWDFRTIYKGLIEGRPSKLQRMSFAIQKSPSDFWVEHWKKKSVIIYDYDVYDFAEELKERYVKRYGALAVSQ